MRSAAVVGVEAVDVLVEVDVAAGLPQWTLVGMAAGAVKESRERVISALANAGYPLPPRRITVSLAPGDLPKAGTAFDLPIAVALLSATGVIDPERVRDLLVLGELGLDGTVRPVRGVLPVARHACRRAAASAPTLVVPPGNRAEAELVHGVRVVCASRLGELVLWLRGGAPPHPTPLPASSAVSVPDGPDLRDVVGQPGARRAMEVAAAGAHAILLVGPPGSGKTTLARCLPGILPALDPDERLDVTAIHSVAGLLAAGGAVESRPFRAPHHSLSVAGLIGGGATPRPGEVSLAHHGVLFLDELLEFPRGALEALRQPLEDGCVVVTRAAGSVRYPARFALVGATNPCPCGRGPSDATGAVQQVCRCPESDIAKYRGRLSGALADRIDMHAHVGRVPLEQLADQSPGEASAVVRARVERARARQRGRYAHLPAVHANAQAPGRWLDRHGGLTGDARALLRDAAERLDLSARGFHRVLRVARTVADLDPGLDPELHGAADSDVVAHRIAQAGECAAGPDTAITVAHVAEALRYRPTGR